MKQIRLFTSIEIPSDTKKMVLEAQKELKSIDKKNILKFANEKNIHITLEFLGNQEEDIIPDINTCLKTICSKHSPFSITLDKLDAFPSLKQPRVIWIGSSVTNDNIIYLDSDLKNCFKDLNIKVDKKPLIPHLTIAHCKRNAYPRLINALSKRLKEFSIPKPQIIKVKKVHLIKSEISDKGALHTKLTTAPLQK